jgi:predicted secreted protein
MAILTGNNGVLQVANNAGTLTTIAALRNFTIETTADTIETTTMGLDARTYVKGLSSFSGSADVYFDSDQFTSGSTGNIALNPNNSNQGVGTTPYQLKVWLNASNAASPSGTAANGAVIVTGFTINSSMDGMIEGSLSFQGSGALTYAAS